MPNRSAILLLAAALLGGCATHPAPRANDTGAVLRPALAHGLRPNVTLLGERAGWSIEERMVVHHVPGVAIGLVLDGKLAWAGGFGVLAAGEKAPVDGDTLFSVGSVSKVVTAALTLRLAGQGVLDLDRDIETYLRSWHVPKNEFSGPPINLRMLMSHTSGLGVHGFQDYPPDAPLPSAVQTLNGVPPARNAAVVLRARPGTRVMYSGGAVTVEQVLLADVTGRPFEQLAEAEVLAPLGMRRSTFLNPLPAERGNIAKAHNRQGERNALPRGYESMPEMAASGLWTSAADLGRFVAALLQSYRGEDGAFLRHDLAAQMMTEVAPSWMGLGPRLNGAGATRYFHHGGSNDSYISWIEGNLANGDGLVVLTNTRNGLPLIAEIRNAVADALSWPHNPPLREARLDLPPAWYATLAGEYRAVADYPLALRKYSAEMDERLDLRYENGRLALIRPDSPEPLALAPIAPNRFAAAQSIDPAGTLQIEFQRAADASVDGILVFSGGGQSYYRRVGAGS